MDYNEYVGNPGLAIALVFFGLMAWNEARRLPKWFWYFISVICLAYGVLMMVSLAWVSVTSIW